MADSNKVFAELEDKMIAMETELRRCTVEELREITEKLKPEVGDTSEKRKIDLIRIISDLFEMEVDDSARGMKMLSLLPLVPARMVTRVADILIKGSVSDESTLNTSYRDNVSSLDSSVLGGGTLPVHRRDFKIVGTIGGSVSKENLNYISLCSQIAEGKRKRYPEKEIAQAVKMAVSPSEKLRTYLDSKPDMDLEQVLSFIRSCLREKPVNELFKELNGLGQNANEDAQSFVMRAMELRQKVIISSQAEGSSLKYDEELVQQQFLHTVRTGLSNDCIKARIEPLVRRGVDISDDLLIHELNVIASEEQESKAKKIAAASCQVSSAAASQSHRTGHFEAEQAPESSENALLHGIRDMQKQMQSLRDEFKQLKSSTTPRHQRNDRSRPHQGGNGKPFGQAPHSNSMAEPPHYQVPGTAQPPLGKSNISIGCSACQKDGSVSRCKHCWKCGSADHYLRDCPEN